MPCHLSHTGAGARPSLSSSQWFSARLNDCTHHCDTKVRLPETVIAVPIGFPIRHEIVQQVAWLVNVDMAQGLYPPLIEKSKLNCTTGLCYEKDANAEVSQFDVWSMIVLPPSKNRTRGL